MQQDITNVPALPIGPLMEAEIAMNPAASTNEPLLPARLTKHPNEFILSQCLYYCYFHIPKSLILEFGTVQWSLW